MTHDDGWKQTGDDRSGISPLLIGLIAVGLISLIFILLNTEKATIDFLVFDVEAGLWLVIVISIALGMALDRLLQLLMRRRKDRRTD